MPKKSIQFDLFLYLNKHESKVLKRSMPRAKALYRKRVEVDRGYGVGANTYRAIRGIEKPSVIFKGWASAALKKAAFRNRVLSARTRQDFERLHAWLGRSLGTYWNKKAKKDLSLAHRYKLIDLFIKCAATLDHRDERMNTNLMLYGHVPLDSKVFTAIDRLFSGVLLTGGRAMGQIKTPEAYHFYQDLIEHVTRLLGVPPLYFDYYAWHMSRKVR